ncbi:hypothetical protein CEUSTIGMA_g3549.t1 [Chlamydomonas eustigma]|uniref:Uncharacterized protein n=1 Tax=Chlamydomonas eustigma TaxID=1157962 RepID=A0A250WZ98_9CHLO|nr:hypothetical protein CEUSTIGMA_g3549.t1 [Chlamydomonas eustigma]|eukprot:GAX76106.1 hypothetical protein CEUSTIGMA_g3549.t1 [Chlamydomonas eustigma]
MADVQGASEELQVVLNSFLPEERLPVNVSNKVRQSAPLQPTLQKRNNSRPSSSLSRGSRTGSATPSYPVNYRVSQSNGGTFNPITEEVKALLPRLSRPTTATSYFSDHSVPGIPAEVPRDGLLKVGCRHIHAQSMALNKDRETLAEEWHHLLCELDPTHPSYIITPIAEDMDSYTLAYAILLIKEGFFEDDYYDKRRGHYCCDDAMSIKTEVLDHLLGGAISRMKHKGKRRPISATPVEYMSDKERISVLTQIYGSNRPSKPARPSSSRARLYNHLLQHKKLDPEVVAEKAEEEEECSFPVEPETDVANWPPPNDPPVSQESPPPLPPPAPPTPPPEISKKVISRRRNLLPPPPPPEPKVVDMPQAYEDIPDDDGASEAEDEKPLPQLADVAAQTDSVLEPPSLPPAVLLVDAGMQAETMDAQDESMQTELLAISDDVVQTEEVLQAEDAVQTDPVLPSPSVSVAEESTQWYLTDMEGWISAVGSLEGLPDEDVHNFLTFASAALRDLQWKSKHLHGLTGLIPAGVFSKALSTVVSTLLTGQSNQSVADSDSASGGGAQHELAAVLAALDAAKKKLDERLNGATLLSLPGVNLLAPEDTPNHFIKAGHIHGTESSLSRDDMFVTSPGFLPQGHLVVAFDLEDELEGSGLPSATHILQEMRCAGGRLVDAMLASVSAVLAPVPMPGSEKASATAARKKLLAHSWQDTRSTVSAFLRLAKTLADMASLACHMLGLKPRVVGTSSAAAAWMGIQATAAALLPQALVMLASGNALSELMMDWSPGDHGQEMCEETFMQAVCQLFDRLHGCGKDLLLGAGEILALGVEAEAQLGVSFRGAEALQSLSALSEMVIQLGELVDSLGMLYGSLAMPECNTLDQIANEDGAIVEVVAGVSNSEADAAEISVEANLGQITADADMEKSTAGAVLKSLTLPVAQEGETRDMVMDIQSAAQAVVVEVVYPSGAEENSEECDLGPASSPVEGGSPKEDFAENNGDSEDVVAVPDLRDKEIGAEGGEVEGHEVAAMASQLHPVLHATALLPIMQAQVFNLEAILNVWVEAFGASWELGRALAIKESLENMGMPSYQDLLRKLEESSEKLLEAEQQLEEASARRAELEAEHAALLDKLEKSSSQLNALEAELKKAAHEAEEVRLAAEAAKAALAEAEKNYGDREAERRKMELLEGELSGKRSALGEATRKLNEIEKKLEEAEAALKQSQGEVDRLKKKIEELEAALKEARAARPAPPIAEKKGCCG